MTPDQVERLSALIGAPYEAENREPGYHCWGAFCAAQEILGTGGLPGFVPARMTVAAKATALATHEARQGWAEIAGPENGCAVMMGRQSLAIHIGCFLDLDGGGVLHALPGSGVCFDGFGALALKGWKCITYLRRI